MGRGSSLCSILNEAKHHTDFAKIDRRVQAHELAGVLRGIFGDDKHGDKETPAAEASDGDNAAEQGKE